MPEARELFTEEWAKTVFPPERTEAFFDALYAGAEEPAFDIALRFVKEENHEYEFSFDLLAKPDRCLVCHITYGLPHVFSRHPIINIKGIVADIGAALQKSPEEMAWELKATTEESPTLFRIPLVVTVQ